MARRDATSAGLCNERWEQVYQLQMQVSILLKRIRKKQKKPRYTVRERLFIHRHMSVNPLEGPNAGWVSNALEAAIEKNGAPRHMGPARNNLDFCMPNYTPSSIASQSRHPRRRTATPVVSLNRARPNMGHTWTPNCPIYFLPIPKKTSRSSSTPMLRPEGKPDRVF